MSAVLAKLEAVDNELKAMRQQISMNQGARPKDPNRNANVLYYRCGNRGHYANECKPLACNMPPAPAGDEVKVST